jgi:acyl-coenzyme A thioesterase PaaI-like protein
VVPDEIRMAWDARRQGAEREAEWRRTLDRYREKQPRLAAEFERRMRAELPAGFRAHAQQLVEAAAERAASVATRQASQSALDALGPQLPELIGGSADLTGSNNTFREDSRVLSAAEPGGNYIHFGVREFAMSAILNGMGLHGGFIPYGGTFLTFSDYARSAAHVCLMKVGTIRLHARFHRPGRGWTDPPGDRAAGQPAHHPGHDGVAAVRCRRNRGSVGGCDRASFRADQPGVDPSGRAASGAHAGASRRDTPRRLRPHRL